MNKILPFLILSPFWAFNQSYAPAAGQPGSTAIPKDSPLFTAWATNGTIERGLQQIDDTSFGYADHGEITNALGAADGVATNSISLGDGGRITLTFDRPIKNGEGADFAVFENGVTDYFLELAFVEVSSDGEHFVRFPNYSETQTETQIHGFGTVDPTYIHNLAGKYRVGFGTPFDLEDLIDSTGIDLQNITHVRLIDVVGSINPDYASYDSQGRIINELFPTPFASSGFDLNGVGVIHQGVLTIEKINQLFKLYPNPVQDYLTITSELKGEISIRDINGRILLADQIDGSKTISTTELHSGIYLLELHSEQGILQQKFIK